MCMPKKNHVHLILLKLLCAVSYISCQHSSTVYCKFILYMVYFAFTLTIFTSLRHFLKNFQLSLNNFTILYMCINIKIDKHTCLVYIEIYTTIYKIMNIAVIYLYILFMYVKYTTKYTNLYYPI